MSNQEYSTSSYFAQAYSTEWQKDKTQIPRAGGYYVNQIRELQEKCSLLEFENRKLLRTLRCVDCNSQIATIQNNLNSELVTANPTESLPSFPTDTYLSTTNKAPLSPHHMLEEASMVEGGSLLPIILDTVAPYDPNTFHLLADESAFHEIGFSEGHAEVEGLNMPYHVSRGNSQYGWLPVTDTGDLFYRYASKDTFNNETIQRNDAENQADTTIPESADSDNSNYPTQSHWDMAFSSFQTNANFHEMDCQGVVDALYMSSPQNAQYRACGREEHSFHADVSFNPVLPLDNILYSPDIRMGFNTRPSNQGLDHYILALQHLIKRSLSVGSIPSGNLEALIADGVLWVVQEAWPEAEWYWKFTASLKGFVQSEIWRNFPCQASFNNLHAAYRPTALQLSVPHSPIIDWLPWPDLRDRVITFQDEIDVDAVCKAAIHNVVSHRHLIDEDRQCKEPLPSFRVWDLQLLEKQSGITCSGKQLTQLAYRPRAPGLIAIEKAYGLVYDDFATQKLHPRFFEQYPFLVCESAKTIFNALDIPSVAVEDVGYPRPLNSKALERLKVLVKEAGVACPV